MEYLISCIASKFIDLQGIMPGQTLGAAMGPCGNLILGAKRFQSNASEIDEMKGR